MDLLERGNGADRQRVVYEANHDFSELMRRSWRHPRRSHEGVGRRVRRVESMGPMSSGPDLFVVCKKLRRGGVPVHHRVPVLRHAAAQARAEARSRRRPGAAEAAARGAARCAG